MNKKTFPLHFLRSVAKNHGYEEIYLNEHCKVISFKRGITRINIYYTTKTVGTCITHPKKGKTQLYRRNVDNILLNRIFKNPRIHTGIGYSEKCNQMMSESKSNNKKNENITSNNKQEQNLKTSMLRKLPNPRAGDPYDAGLFGNRQICRWNEHY